MSRRCQGFCGLVVAGRESGDRGSGGCAVELLGAATEQRPQGGVVGVGGGKRACCSAGGAAVGCWWRGGMTEASGVPLGQDD